MPMTPLHQYVFVSLTRKFLDGGKIDASTWNEFFSYMVKKYRLEKGEIKRIRRKYTLDEKHMEIADAIVFEVINSHLDTILDGFSSEIDRIAHRYGVKPIHMLAIYNFMARALRLALIYSGNALRRAKRSLISYYNELYGLDRRLLSELWTAVQKYAGKTTRLVECEYIYG